MERGLDAGQAAVVRGVDAGRRAGGGTRLRARGGRDGPTGSVRSAARRRSARCGRQDRAQRGLRDARHGVGLRGGGCGGPGLHQPGGEYPLGDLHVHLGDADHPEPAVEALDAGRSREQPGRRTPEGGRRRARAARGPDGGGLVSVQAPRGSHPRGLGRVHARARPLRLVGCGDRRQRGGGCDAARTRADLPRAGGEPEALVAHRLVAGALDRALRRLDLVRGRPCARTAQALRGGDQHRLPRMLARDGVRRRDVDGRGGAAVRARDRRRHREDREAPAAAAGGRLFVQSDRTHVVLHAALEHSGRRARGAWFLSDGRVRREHRLAHGRRRDGRSRAREPRARPRRLRGVDRPGPQRARAPVRLPANGGRAGRFR